MQTNLLHTTTIGTSLRKALRGLLILGILFALTGCSPATVTAGTGGIPITGGDWTGRSADGAFSMQFRIGVDGANIFIVTFSYPCGDKNASVFPPKLIKAGLNAGAFEADSTDASDLLPRLVVTGRFTDRTHAEGTWQFFGDYDVYLEFGCPAASGTWTGGPE